LPKALYSLDIYDKLSGTIIFPTNEGQLMDVFIGSDAEITNKLDLSNCNNLRKITILGKLRGGIVPSGKFEKVIVSSNAEITGGLDLSHCTKLSEVQTKKGLENLLTLPRRSPFLIRRTLN
jgi:hypothetical protein